MAGSRRLRKTQGHRLGLAGVLILAGILAGCGFRPLYGTDSGGASSFTDLESVQITPLPDRTGQVLHNLLRDRINPRGQPVEPKYILNISLTQEAENLAIREDETATRANLRLSATFDLVSTENNEVVFRGLSNSTNSYNVVGSQFATFTSARDAQERALRELSEDIRLRLAVYFSQVREGKGT